MPIYYDIEQRTEQWFYLRIGLPTASDFSELITPTGKPSKQVDGLLSKLLAESMMGHEIEGPTSAWMLRGEDLEPKAVEVYEFDTGVETQRGGFVTNDDGTYGCSPDRLVGEDGLLEVKCPAPNTHMGYILDHESMRVGKSPQVQGQLLVTGRKWADLVSYHPEMPLVIVRVDRDEEYIGKLKAALDTFADRLREARTQLEGKYGVFPDNKPMSPAPDDNGEFTITDADLDEMIRTGAVAFSDQR